MAWWIYALLGALAAAATAILGKLGVEGVPSNLAVAIRVTVVVLMAWLIVAATGEYQAVSRRTLLWLSLSGIATGLSWLAYFKALQMAPASSVQPLDKMSLPLTIVLAGLLLHEKISWKVGLGALLMTIGALLTLA